MILCAFVVIFLNYLITI